MVSADEVIQFGCLRRLEARRPGMYPLPQKHDNGVGESDDKDEHGRSNQSNEHEHVLCKFDTCIGEPPYFPSVRPPTSNDVIPLP